jgi:hypothetical protein
MPLSAADRGVTWDRGTPRCEGYLVRFEMSREFYRILGA